MPTNAAPLRLGFAGTPVFAARILEHLCAHGSAPKLVLTQPNRRSGRGKKLKPSPVNQAATSAGIECLAVPTLRDPDTVSLISAASLDALVVVAYGLLLPRAVLDLPRFGCINVHASLLPRWRGAAPIERAILAGDDRTGISIMSMDEGLDTGPVYAVDETPIFDDDTGDTLHDRLALLGADLLSDVLRDLPNQEPEPQPESGACYAAKLDPAEARLDFSEDATQLARKIRAFNSRMPAFGILNGERVRLLRAHSRESRSQGQNELTAGTLLAASAQGLCIATGSGQLVVTELQLALGKGRPMDVGSALNGYAELLSPGGCFDA